MVEIGLSEVARSQTALPDTGEESVAPISHADGEKTYGSLEVLACYVVSVI